MKKHEYLEIYPSEVAARKINKHLDQMISDKPRIYRKTLLRYKKLAQILLDCVGKIIRVMQSEMLLSSEDTEFQELASEFDVAQIDELRDSVDILGNLVDENPSADSKKLAGEMLTKYKSVFSQAAKYDFGYVEVNECAELLNMWISQRFSGLNANFKYQIKQLPIWATFIVIAYGKYHAMGQSVQFVSEFTEWCNSLLSDASNCWALPYNIFNMTKTINPGNFTLDAVIIYDILINGCLYQLIDVKIPMDSAYVAKLVKEYQPDLAYDVKTRFNRQDELIESLYLRRSSENVEETGT